MTTLRTPLEVALGVQFPLDFDDLDLGDYDLQDARDAETEKLAVAEALDAGEQLYSEAVRAAIRPSFRGGQA